MSELEEQFKRVNTKLQQLLKQHLLLQKENEKLKDTLKIVQLSKDQDTEQINKLQQQVSILKTSIGQMTEADKKAFEKQINQYIKEIDKCIGLLSE
jgi:type I site-specific restriction endonuclease